MSIKDLIRPFTWASYSRKLVLRIDTPYCIGTFSKEEAEVKNLHLAKGTAGSLDDGNYCELFLLVDREDGGIVDARFQAYGHSALIGALEIACELMIGKNYEQARRISADLIEKHVRDSANVPAFPEETFSHINMAIDAIEVCYETCIGIPLAEGYVAPPITGHSIETVEGGYPGFSELSLKEQLAVIDQVLEQEVRPYVEMDAGGIEVINYHKDKKEVVITYHGSCTSCHSATGATLSYVQQILRAKVDPELTVTPEF